MGLLLMPSNNEETKQIMLDALRRECENHSRAKHAVNAILNVAERALTTTRINSIQSHRNTSTSGSNGKDFVQDIRRLAASFIGHVDLEARSIVVENDPNRTERIVELLSDEQWLAEPFRKWLPQKPVPKRFCSIYPCAA
ncbi:MAG: hypothetical protein ACFB2Z_08080 [Maricaulaceae bacterium]